MSPTYHRVLVTVSREKIERATLFSLKRVLVSSEHHSVWFSKCLQRTRSDEWKHRSAEVES